jgi:hypothetical protein
MSRGFFVLRVLHLLVGLGSIYFVIDLLLSQQSFNFVAGLFGLVFTGCLGVSGVALSIRRKWSWRVAIAAQIVALACPLIVALMGIFGLVTASGDFAYAAVAGSFMFFLAGMTIAIPCLLGLLYTMKPHVRALFDKETSRD